MNWFAGIIATIINTLANGLGGLVTAVTGTGLTKSAMGNIIMSGFFPFESDGGVAATDPSGNASLAQAYPAWGAGNFSDLMDPKAVDSLGVFSLSFWAIGWTFLAISIYLLAVQVSGAAESSIQRDRMKKGIASLIISAVLIWQGPHLAVLITQLFFYMSYYFIGLNPLQNWTSLSTDGDAALLNSVVNFLQAILSLIVWVVYQFRLVFLYVWMVFYPLAMAFYANDKTRGIAKMWWTEWIYQMAVPFGQAVVFGIASAIASPGKSGAALTAADVFVALAGTIGLLGSAVYVRKLVELVAQGFGASMIGADHGMSWGNLAMMGGAAVAGDAVGKMGVKASSKAAGGTLGKAFHAADNKWGRKFADRMVKKHGEVHAGAIQNGASMDDILMNQKLSGAGDAIQAGGAGLETAGGGKGGSYGSGYSSGGGSGSSGRIPFGRGIRSGTLSEMGNAAQSVKSTLRNSNFGTGLSALRKGFKNEGGVMGRLGDKIAAKTSSAASSVKSSMDAKGGRVYNAVSRVAGGVSSQAQKHLANSTNRGERLQTLRNHLSDALQNNEHNQRVPGISAEYDPKNNTFQGMSSPAQKRYNEASGQFVQALQTSGMSYKEANNVLQHAQTRWDDGGHLKGLGNYSSGAQEAYRKAYTAYRPAQMDTKARDAVQAGKVAVMPSKDPRKNQMAGTNAFLNDARNAIMNQR